MTALAAVSDDAAITLRGVRLRRGGREVLAGIDLAVARGALVALTGPSGSGKTSLLRVVARLDRPDEGVVEAGVSRGMGGVGYVAQRDALFPHMTVATNIAFGLTTRARPEPAAIAGRVAECLRLVDAEGLDARYPHQLSGGQRQRVALARALAPGPALLLLDEPFTALDEAARETLRTRLRTLHDRTGLTTILVTHDQAEAAALADRVLVLRDGRLA